MRGFSQNPSVMITQNTNPRFMYPSRTTSPGPEPITAVCVQGYTTDYFIQEEHVSIMEEEEKRKEELHNTSQHRSLSPGLSSLEHSCSTLTPDELLIGHEMRSPARCHDPSERLLRSCSSALYVTDGNVQQTPV
ncbi:unnamed protein product [Leuciscus chuanchicus]